MSGPPGVIVTSSGGKCNTGADRGDRVGFCKADGLRAYDALLNENPL
jgi:hypothetical protein